jgi:hypothetical protein
MKLFSEFGKRRWCVERAVEVIDLRGLGEECVLWGAKSRPELVEKVVGYTCGDMLCVKVGVICQHTVDVWFRGMKPIIDGFLFVPVVKKVVCVLCYFVCCRDSFPSFVKHIYHGPRG